MSAVGGSSPDQQRPTGTLVLVLDAVLVVVLGCLLWVTAEAEAAQMAAASGHGRPGVMVIEGMRPGASRFGGADIPVGTFTEPDGTRTSGVAWQDHPAAVGARKEGVRVGDRAWDPGVRLGAGDVLVTVGVVGLFVWRVLALLRSWRGRVPTGP